MNTKFKIKKYILYGAIAIVSLLFLNSYMRSLISTSFLLSINLPVYVALFMLINNKKKSVTKEQILRFFIVTIIVFVMVEAMISSNAFKPRLLLSICLPLIFVFSNLDSENCSLDLFKNATKIINFTLLVVAILGVVDTLSGFIITNYFTDFYGTDAMRQMRIDEPNRLITILGHPLVTSNIGLISCIFNAIELKYLDQDKKKIKKHYFYYFVAMIVIGFSGSKICFLLSLVIIMMLNFDKKKYRYMVLTVIIVYILYIVGAFDVIIERFLVGYVSGDFSTGRNVHFANLYSSGALKFDWFKGHGQEINEHFIIALEYPFLRLSFRYGIFFAVILYTYIFVYPVIKLWRRKQLFLLWLTMFYMVAINTYSSICSDGDGMLTYCLILFLILNFSNTILIDNNYNHTRK